MAEASRIPVLGLGLKELRFPFACHHPQLPMGLLAVTEEHPRGRHELPLFVSTPKGRWALIALAPVTLSAADKTDSSAAPDTFGEAGTTGDRQTWCKLGSESSWLPGGS